MEIPMKDMVWADYTVVGLYMIVMIVLGVLAGKMNKNDEDYFKGGSKVPWVMSSLSFFIGTFSAYMFVAASAMAYATGFASLLLFTSGAWACIFAMFFLVSRFRRSRVVSPMELIVARYGETTRTLFTFIRVPAYVLVIANWLYVLCIFVSSALGLTGDYTILGFELTGLQLCLVVTGLIAVVYTTIGGLWAVIITSTVQFAIVMVVTLVILPYCFIELSDKKELVDGVSQFFANPPSDDYFHLIKPSQTLFFTLSYMMLNLINYAGDFSLVQRSVCVTDERAAQKSMALSAILLIFAPILWIAPVFVMRAKLPDMAALWPDLINPYDGTYVTISRMILPNGMIGLTLAAIFAATMSSASTIYNILSAIFTKDIYATYIHKKATHKHLMFVGKLSTFGFGILSIVIAFGLATYEDAFNTSLIIFSHFGIVFSIPVAVAVFIKRMPRWTALAAMPVCLATTMFIEFVVPQLARNFDSNLLNHIAAHLFQYKVFGAVVANFVVIGLASLFYKYDPDKEVETDKLFKMLETPVNIDNKKPLFVPNLLAYRFVGWSLLFFAIVIAIISAFPSIEDARRINVAAVIVMFISFAVIQWLTSPKYSPIKLVRMQTK